ncbi:MAG TPA: 3-deoxy-D-manno-octulosonic acid transferase [Verrucomicrobiales bacterium]|nr:3-deoxy-D-manno-octulosonic acid transferase [Verrucomicrobiales bacterium]
MFLIVLYNLLLPFFLLASLPRLLRTMRRRGGAWKDLKERFACYPPGLRDRLASLEGPIWIHAVSVGEVLIAARLIESLRQLSPQTPIFLTTTTTTGYATARQRLPDLPIAHSPLDLRSVVRRILDCVRPSQIILTESEVWPNLLSLAHARQIPVSIINARLSPRSRQRYLRFRRFLAPLLSRLDLVCVQESADRELWIQLGLDPGRVVHTGSIKFDPSSSSHDARQIAEFSKLLQSIWPGPTHARVLLGSSHQGEERLLAEIVVGLRTEFPDLSLIAVPRHFERRQEVLADLAAAQIPVFLRTQLPAPAPPRPSPVVLVVDTTGELPSWYALADVVVVGKSFLAHGGQNPVEPILAEKPVVTGPHMENFAALCDMLLRNGGIRRATDAGALRDALREFLRQPAAAAAMAERGRAVLQNHVGATRRTAGLLLFRPPGARP